MSGPWAFINQDLISHSLNTAKIAERIAEESYRCSVARRIRIASGGKVIMEENKVLELIKIAALLHDVGKAADQYQRQLQDGKLSFRCHELPSAFIAYDLMEKMKYVTHERVLVFLTILNSHQAMRSPAEMIRESNIREWSFKEWWGKTKPIFDILKTEERIFDSMDKNLTIKNISDLYERVINYARKPGNAEWVKLYCLFLAPVVWGDICDASAFRPKDEHPSKFREELLGGCV
ncbi:MAG: CRISPR-associated endonuclease Cas3'' [Thermoproteota archaeon]